MSTQVTSAGQTLLTMLKTYRKVQGPFAFAQAWHESGGLDSKLALLANNYWGIKWRVGSNQDFASFKTWEHFKGRDVIITARFAKWDSIEAGVAAYWNLVKRRYPDAFDATSIHGFALGLVSGPRKWATDPRYIQRLESVYYSLVSRGILTFTGRK